MKSTHIRIARTPQVDHVLSFLKAKYHVLSEAEIIKIALSEKYHSEKEDMSKKEQARQAWEHLKVEGKKLGDKLLAEKGLKRENVTEQEFYDLILAPSDEKKNRT